MEDINILCVKRVKIFIEIWSIVEVFWVDQSKNLMRMSLDIF